MRHLRNLLICISSSLFGLTCTLPASASISFDQAFSRHTAIMLLIDPNSGEIVDANEAASRFYGYPLTDLKQLKIQQINTLTPEQVARERSQANEEGRNYFIFKHRRADGDIRTVEVYSIPIVSNGRTLLYSVISDISEKRNRSSGLWHYQENLEETVSQQTQELREKGQLIILTMAGAILILLLFLALLIAANRRSSASKHRTEEQEATLNTILNNISDAIFYTDMNRNIIQTNRGAKHIFGYSDAELHGASAALLYADPEDYRTQGIFRFTPHAEPRTDLYEVTYQRKDGSTFIGETLGSVIKNPAGHALGYIGVIRDISNRKKTEIELRRAASVFNNTSEGIIITSPDGTILDVNKAFTTITGYNREEAVGHSAGMLRSDLQTDAFYAAMWQQLLAQGHWSGEIYNRHKNGNTYIEQLSINAVTDDQHQTLSYIALFYDITSKKEHEKQLHHIAHYDALTELPNRLLLADRLRQGMLHAKRQGDFLALVYIDLDGFKEINDHFGHEVGDKVLIEIAWRMKQTLRESDTIARLGGDEFVAVLTDLTDESACLPLLDRILESIAKGIKINDSLLRVTTSLGVTFYSSEDSEPDTLLRQADQAMYQAKLQGKNCYYIFDPIHDRSLKGRNERIERLQQALQNDEFILYYQPKVNMSQGTPIGVEALIRWDHPEKGILPPADFLPDIDNHILDIELGKWVIDNALKQQAEWINRGLNLKVSVNISAQQIQAEGFIAHLQAALAQHPSIQPQNFELEILESSALQDLQRVSQVIDQCSRIGVQFSLDDFGTGYSSLSYLRSLPVQVLKIDRSFVDNMLINPGDMAIIRGIIGLTKAFQRGLVAEGVETVEQGEVLIRLGCNIAQGYVIAQPMPPSEIQSWAANWQPPTAWVRATEQLSHKDPL